MITCSSGLAPYASMTPAEVDVLYDTVFDGTGDHLDIGTCAGGSAIIAWAALSSRGSGKVVTIDVTVDTKDRRDYPNQPGSSVIERILADSHKFNWGDRRFGTVFVDGDHTYEGCLQDLKLAERLGAETIIVHDMDLSEVAVAVRDFGWPRTAKADKLVVLQKASSP